MSGQTLLVVCQSRSGSVTRLVEALVAGTHTDGIEGVRTVVKPPLDARAEDVEAADLIVLAGPENFGLINGLMKDFLERIYYPCLDQTVGLPYALVVHGNNDGTGAIRTTEKIVTGLRWKAVQPPLLSVGELTADHLAQATELGATLAGGLSLGMW